jgi:hypothetical protein
MAMSADNKGALGATLEMNDSSMRGGRRKCRANR